MKRSWAVRRWLAAGAMLLAAVLLVVPGGAPGAAAQGVGGATWTPSESETSVRDSRFLRRGDAIELRTDTVWNADQARGLARYNGTGLRYTHETNDRSGRLSATGFWVTNLPDPSYDRDDDDGDRRWEEAEITFGRETPVAGFRYTTGIQYSRWHPKREKRTCTWAWDRRRGTAEVLSQLSRNLLGEWQAERYTLAYDSVDYERVDARPQLPRATARARCRDADPGANQTGVTVTFARPLSWRAFRDIVSVGSAKWTAFEAVGTADQDDLLWTCGGPVDDALRTTPCKTMGVQVEGISAAVGYLDDLAADQLRDHPDVVAVDGLRDSLTDLLFDVGGFGVERPGLTVNDRYWERVLAD